MEHIGGGGDGDGSDIGGWDRDLCNGVGINECAYEDERVRRRGIGRRLDWVVGVPLGGSNALARVGINIGFLDKNDIYVSGVNHIKQA